MRRAIEGIEIHSICSSLRSMWKYFERPQCQPSTTPRYFCRSGRKCSDRLVSIYSFFHRSLHICPFFSRVPALPISSLLQRSDMWGSLSCYNNNSNSLQQQQQRSLSPCSCEFRQTRIRMLAGRGVEVALSVLYTYTRYLSLR